MKELTVDAFNLANDPEMYDVITSGNINKLVYNCKVWLNETPEELQLTGTKGFLTVESQGNIGLDIEDCVQTLRVWTEEEEEDQFFTYYIRSYVANSNEWGDWMMQRKDKFTYI